MVKQHGSNQQPKKATETILKWTGNQSNSIEFMYALHNEGVLKYGNLSLNEIAS
jgi:hypothetical protein